MAKRKRTSRSTRVNKKPTDSQHRGKGFLDLPPEIRNIIYDMIIEDQSQPGSQYPNLMLVNQQTYGELAPLAIRSRKSVLSINTYDNHNRSSERDRQLIRLCRMIRPETAAFFTQLSIEESTPDYHETCWTDLGPLWVKELAFFDIGKVARLLADFTNLSTFRWVVELGRTRSEALLWQRAVRRSTKSINVTIYGLNQMFSHWPMLSRLLIHPNLDRCYGPPCWRFEPRLLQVQAVQRISGRSVEIECQRWRPVQGDVTNGESSADVNLVWVG